MAIQSEPTKQFQQTKQAKHERDEEDIPWADIDWEAEEAKKGRYEQWEEFTCFAFGCSPEELEEEDDEWCPSYLSDY